jgi:hypothetical protein
MGLEDISDLVPRLNFLTEYISQEMIFTFGVPLALMALGIFLAFKYRKVKL